MLHDFENESKKALEHLKMEFSKLQIGRASANLVEDVMVSAYGSMQTLKGVATITVKDSQTLLIQPWDKSLMSHVEKAISEANLGVNPQNDGINIFIKIPQPTEERRREFVKRVHELGENARIHVRSARLDNKKKLERMEDEGQISEDDLNRLEKDLQSKVDNVNKEIDKMVKEKEEMILSV